MEFKMAYGDVLAVSAVQIQTLARYGTQTVSPGLAGLRVNAEQTYLKRSSPPNRLRQHCVCFVLNSVANGLEKYVRPPWPHSDAARG